MAIQVKKWDSGLRVIEPEVYLATGLEDIFGEVQSQIGDKEFSILLKGDWNDKCDGFYVQNDYHIPLQEVESASVDYHKSYLTEKLRDEAYNRYNKAGLSVNKSKIDGDFVVRENLHQLRKDGYTVIAHSHPFLKGDSGHFSSADDEHINSHFPCSILLNGEGEAVMASLLFPTQHKSLKVRVETDKITQLEIAHKVEVTGVDKISKRTNNIVQNGFEFSHNRNGRKLKDIFESNKQSPVKIADRYVPSLHMWQSEVEKEIKSLVEQGYPEGEVRTWYEGYEETYK